MNNNLLQVPGWLKAFRWQWQPLSGIALLLIGLVVGVIFVNRSEKSSSSDPYQECQTMVGTESYIPLTSDQKQQLAGKEGLSRDEIRQIIGEPFCVLPRLSLRPEVITEREGYVTENNEFLIVAYEGGTYLGYGLQTGDRASEAEVAAAQPNLKEIELKQTWGIQAGHTIGNYPVVSGLGEISIQISGGIVAPADGFVADRFVFIAEGLLLNSGEDCLLFSSAQTPAYLIELCGLHGRRTGVVKQGEILGRTGGYLHLALFSFRRDADGKRLWMYVPPSTQLIERLLP